MASSDQHLDPAVIEAANAAIDRALGGLFDLFKDRPRVPHEHFTTYDIIIENGEVRWEPTEVDRLVDEAFRELFGEQD